MAKTKVTISGGGFLQEALEDARQKFSDTIQDVVRSEVTRAAYGLSERENEVFRELTDQWVRPMDVGGRDGSDHARILAKLVRMGLVERKQRSAFGRCRGSYLYRNPRYQPPPKTPRKLTNFDHCYRFTKILASYECAGVDQDPNDSRPCGKCGPCEANKFLQSRPGLALSMLED